LLDQQQQQQDLLQTMQTADNAKAQLLLEDRRRLLEHVIHVSRASAVLTLGSSLARRRPGADVYPVSPLAPSLRCSRVMGADCSFPSACQWQSLGCWTPWTWQPSCAPCQQLAPANQQQRRSSCCRSVRGQHGEADPSATEPETAAVGSSSALHPCQHRQQATLQPWSCWQLHPCAPGARRASQPMHTLPSTPLHRQLQDNS
jgi:hypothetical protein